MSEGPAEGGGGGPPPQAGVGGSAPPPRAPAVAPVAAAPGGEGGEAGGGRPDPYPVDEGVELGLGEGSGGEDGGSHHAHGEESDGSDDEMNTRSMEQIIRHMLLSRGMHLAPRSQEPREKLMTSFDLEGVVELIRSGKAKNIIVISGAGISVSAGIPDFRTPGTGLYDNLKKYNLPDPQAVFDLSYFRDRPEPFYLLAHTLYPGNFRPTPTHHFVRLLERKGLLLRNFTQNIDTLEREARVEGEKLVEAHGSFAGAHCIEPGCKKEHDPGWVREHVFRRLIPHCLECGGLVKPDIVFFGEKLPDKFFDSVNVDLPKCDLLIVLGTSLTVQPFASLVDRVGSDCPRLLINREVPRGARPDPIMRMLGMQQGLNLDEETNYRDAVYLGDCDEGTGKLAGLLGWGDELSALIAEGAARPINAWTPDEAFVPSPLATPADRPRSPSPWHDHDSDGDPRAGTGGGEKEKRETDKGKDGDEKEEEEEEEAGGEGGGEGDDSPGSDGGEGGVGGGGGGEGRGGEDGGPDPKRPRL